MKEERILKVMFNKAGGNAGKGAYNSKLSIPKTWINEMGIDLDDREVRLEFDGKKIIIEKLKK